MSNPIYLAQTDTTVGFLSRDAQKLNAAKGRDKDQKVIRAVCDLAVLKEFARTPKKHRNIVRRSQKTTFIFSNGEAIRVIYGDHAKFFSAHNAYKWIFSTSANKTNENFDITHALKTADIIVYDKRGFFEDAPSKIYKLSRDKISKKR